ncbi:CGGC domain-containing protein [Clostridium grantii]|uniref:CGGC domain-containing protein n=1 Tax=Clostridium grantii DSM 8605 TaxID=1121316 RepID=A0A1M5VUX6_9CLOT|nr:CGGC domain-containing protein [Clostridium grantii]SHH79062.1 CGGC domain-containing protein [Clostridium grantii DSM 8605]
MKIAIIVRKETMDKCSGKGCLNAFFKKIDAFENYDENTELVAFTHNGGDLEHKIQKLKDNNVQVIHLSSCIRGKCEDYEELIEKLSKDFKVVGYTHGAAKKISNKNSFLLPIYDNK